MMSQTWFRVHSAVYLLFVKEGQLLMLRRCNTGYEDGRLSLVAGKLDGGEEVRQAARREALEEVGVEVDADALEVATVLHRWSDTGEWIDFFLTVKSWQGEPFNKEPDKCSELLWVPLDALPDDTIAHVRLAVNHVRGGVVYDSYGWESQA
ncbi:MULTISPECIES: NUDIX hydrolase [Paenibacillus]|uniref:NUDIX hydrolase n=1 Tax=Paenibacillus TaxID=44249 RepID=UPI0022B89CE4|nr:NUDIX domain-containing protein [Paenibacillus caseinilyticus]MCZ8519231.1 NUDIX domain-containing protein [Paenibacillus caseinilyticus]